MSRCPFKGKYYLFQGWVKSAQLAFYGIPFGLILDRGQRQLCILRSDSKIGFLLIGDPNKIVMRKSVQKAKAKNLDEDQVREVKTAMVIIQEMKSQFGKGQSVKGLKFKVQE